MPVVGLLVWGCWGRATVNVMWGCEAPPSAPKQYKSTGLVGRPSLVPPLEANSAVCLWSVPRPSACAGARCILCAPMPAAAATGYGHELLWDLYKNADVDIIPSVVLIVRVGKRWPGASSGPRFGRSSGRYQGTHAVPAGIPQHGWLGFPNQPTGTLSFRISIRSLLTQQVGYLVHE